MKTVSLSLLVLVCTFNPLFAEQSTIELNDIEKIYSLVDHAYILHDTENNVSLDKILSGDITDQFNHYTGANLVLDHSYWLRIKLTRSINTSSTWYLTVPRQRVSQLSLFSPTVDPQGELSYFESQIGSEQSLRIFSKDSYLEIPGHIKADEYLYIKFTTERMSPLIQIKSNLLAIHNLSFNLLFNCLIYGILLAMIFYHLILTSLAREVFSLYYTLCMIAVFIYVVFLLGDIPGYLGISGAFSSAAIGISGGAIMTLGTRFSQISLVTKNTQPRVHTILNICLLLSLIIIIIIPFNFGLYVVLAQHLLSLIVVVTCIMASVHAIRKGHEAAKYYLLSWSILFIGMLWMNIDSILQLNLPLGPTKITALSLAITSITLAFAMAFRVRQLRHSHLRLEKFQEISMIDKLTGLRNRRFLEEVMSKFIANAHDSNTPFAVAFFDLDDFKLINDAYGHNFGDKVLIKVSELVISSLRVDDIGCRYGGDEFIILFPNTSQENAKKMIERLQKFLSEMKFDYKGNSVNVRLSAGIATWRRNEDQAALIDRADKALYQAKNGGKNRICFASDEFQLAFDQV